ncbi:CAZyme family GH5 [Agaricus bisporus var. burnettii]|uniref:mannan endo-1,4-beta-mannosidase n=1 Tax=Agaricus bisporus var. burnettii TaxID=192524 RepID=A0A8H7F6K3_AGABI|nr:CAZyme family GH5 [Agaricus bisporus var. burnettii]
MFVRSCWPLLLSLLFCNAFAKPSTKREVIPRDTGASSNFVTQQGDKLMVNGSTFNYIGTTAYWLSSLNTDEDIDFTLGNISQAGFNVVRTWAFNDVETIPENGTWIQLIQNGTLLINEGPNGLQRLDKVIELAKKHGLYILLSLTNNWNPRPLTDNIQVVDPLSALRLGARDVTPGTNNSLPRGFLSNDYGGMDAYVRQFGGPREHDQFFTNQTLINAFKNFTSQIVSRYANNTNVLAWELANDPQCSSSINASSSCIAQHVTQWHSDVAQHVKQLDPNHIVASGHQGFLCTDCPKLFPRVTAPPPRPSPRAEARRSVLPWTRERILKERKEAFKKTRALAKKSGQSGDGIRIRGRWVSTPTRRQDSGLGSAFDGSHGVDSEDIFNIPEIGLGSFMVFPDQVKYGPDDPNLPPFNNTVKQGQDWIRSNVDMARLFGKPVAMSGFGLVTQPNTQAFVPFNSSVAPFASDSNLAPQTPFATNDQQIDAYQQWMQTGILGGVQGMIHYQWMQPGLTAQPGTTISPDVTQAPTSPDITHTTSSPNDGYGDQDTAPLSSIVQQFAPDFQNRQGTVVV